MPSWGLPRGRFPWLCGTDVTAFVQSPAGLQGWLFPSFKHGPFFLQAKFLCLTPTETACLLECWRLYSHPRSCHRPRPTIFRTFPRHLAMGATTLSSPQQLAWTPGTPASAVGLEVWTSATSLHLWAQWEAVGSREAAVRGSGSVHWLKKPQVKPTPSKGNPRIRFAPLQGQPSGFQLDIPGIKGTGGNSAEINVWDGSCSWTTLKAHRLCCGDPSMPGHCSRDACLQQSPPMRSPGCGQREDRLKAGRHLVKATGRQARAVLWGGRSARK